MKFRGPLLAHSYNFNWMLLPVRLQVASLECLYLWVEFVAERGLDG
jgi:hypothetical protein